jgi:acyl-CoA thioesterase-2
MTTDALTFLGLARRDDTRWTLPVTEGISTAASFLFGGCGLGAATAAPEETTARPVVWATSQYLSFARLGETVDIEVIVSTSGHHITQARALGHVGAREIFTVNAALGQRPDAHNGTWIFPPDVLAPHLCPPRRIYEEHIGTVISRLEQRLAAGRLAEAMDGRHGSGRCALWVSMSGLAVSGAGLAVLGDYVPFGIGQALGLNVGGTSLDNTIRVLNTAHSDWILLDIQIHGIAGGFAHGLVHLWSEDGTLLGTASQSVIVRERGHRRY